MTSASVMKRPPFSAGYWVFTDLVLGETDA